MRVTRVLHVSVNTEAALAPTRDFYARLFGLPSLPRPDIPGVPGHWFGVSDAELHLVDAPAGPGPIRPAGNHFCFGVEDLDDAVAELEAAGIAYLRASQGEIVQIWIADPAGNTIELQQDRP